MIKKICIFTGTRAEYGLLKPLINKLKLEKDFKLQLVISASHLSHYYGYTIKDIDTSDISEIEKIEILLSSDTPIGTLKSMGLGLINYSETLNKLKPDICIILGDRYEAFAFAISSYILKIPIAHLYGGETTEGALDEGFRHSITKLSYIHFTSTELYRKRVIQLGENPNRVFNIGSLGVENIKNMKFLSKKELEKRLNIRFNKNNYLITYHSCTLDNNSITNNLNELIKVLDNLENSFFIFTKSNSDFGGLIINDIISDFVNKNKNKSILFDSMGEYLYLNTMKYVDAVIGNSSSGIIEAPNFRKPTINLGDRQKGRMRVDSIIDCKENYEDIKNSIDKALSDKFINKIKKMKNPYGDGKTSEKIINKLKIIDINNFKKAFYNIDYDI